MFKYKILKQKEIEGGFTAEVPLLKGKNEILKHFPELEEKLKELEKNLKKSIEERKKEIEKEAFDFPENMKIEFIYAPTISRYLFQKNDDYVLEVEYYPIDKILKEIKEKTGKEIKLYPDRKIYLKSIKGRLYLQQYDPQRKKSVNVLNVKENTENRMLLQPLVDLWNSFHFCNVN